MLIFYIIPQFFSSTYTNNLDILSRSHFDEFFFNIYYYFWTSFFFIFILNYVVLSVVLFYSNTNNLKYLLIKFILLLLLFLNIFEYWNLNSVYWWICNNSNFLNKLLLNSINKYHPFLFYITVNIVAFLLVRYSTSSYYDLKTLFTPNNKLGNLGFTNTTPLYLIFITLFLGSWWALQEGSWGGWWNWDASEIFGLLIGLYFLFFIHLSPSVLSKINLVYVLKIVTNLIVLLYILTQLNFRLISHNFSNYLNTNNYVYVYVIFFIYYFFIRLYLIFSSYNLHTCWVLKVICKDYNPRLYPPSTFNKTVVFVLLYIWVVVTVAIGYTPLLNEVVLNFTLLDIVHLSFKVNYANSAILTVFFIYFWRLSIFTVFILIGVLFFKNLWIVFLFINIYTSCSYLNMQHFILIYFLLFNVISYNWDYIYTATLSLSFNLGVLNYFNLFIYEVPILLSNFFSKKILFLDNLIFSSSPSRTILRSSHGSKSQTNIFHLTLSYFKEIQTLLLGGLNTYLSIKVLNNYVITLLNYYLFMKVLTYFIFFFKKVIIF